MLPILRWLPAYDRRDLRPDITAGVTVGAIIVPQAMAYALLAGLPPEVGLYAAGLPVIVYALFGTSRQLAVGPAALVSLLTASALGPLVAEGTTGYVTAAAALAVTVGLVHLLLGTFRLGFLADYLSHPVLVGFTTAAALIIGASQLKHLLGLSTPRHEHVADTVADIVAHLGDTHGATLAIGAGSVVGILALRRVSRRLPGALIVAAAATALVEITGLADHGVATVGDIPGDLPAFAWPGVDAPLWGSLLVPALVITLMSFVESSAVAKVYARRNGYEISPNAELRALGFANVTSGLVGGQPITGGFSRTAVNADAGARTPLASIVTGGVILATIAFFTPLLTSLPRATLAAVILVAVAGLVDVDEIRHVVHVRRADAVPLLTAFVATVLLGVELGIAVAVAVSLLVVVARMATPHTAVLGRLPGTTTYRNVERFADARPVPGLHIVRLDASISFANAAFVKRLLLGTADRIPADTRLVLDASGINDLDSSGAQMLSETLDEFDRRHVELHLADLKGPVRDVLRRSGLWERLEGRLHPTVHDAVRALAPDFDGSGADRRAPVDERDAVDPPAGGDVGSSPHDLHVG
ncbi:MAG: solute carrier 26 family protein [Actinomyces sp.]|nr:MAG: solute carrier 26 family protein [Actinomyces sp.]